MLQARRRVYAYQHIKPASQQQQQEIQPPPGKGKGKHRQPVGNSSVGEGAGGQAAGGSSSGAGGSSSTAGGKALLVPVLEEAPKWCLLRDVLQVSCPGR
jgi:hypothetical protein